LEFVVVRKTCNFLKTTGISVLFSITNGFNLLGSLMLQNGNLVNCKFHCLLQFLHLDMFN